MKKLGGAISLILSLSVCGLVSCKTDNATGSATIDNDAQKTTPLVQKENDMTSVPGTPEGTKIPVEYARMLGQFFYVWGWPMADTHARAAVMQKVPEPGLQGGILPIAPLNSLSMLTDYIDPAQRFVAAPNQDVVYGLASLALDREPVVVQVPDFGNRFWVFQVCDQRTDSFAKLGKMYDTKPGFYLLVGPGWKGTTPQGITQVFHSPTNTAFVIPRAFVDDTPEDKAALQPQLNGIGVYPLSKFDGKVKTTDWKKTPHFPAAAGGSGETQWVDPNTFFDLLPTLLDEVPPLPGEESIYTQGRTLVAAAKNNPALKKELVAAATETEQNLIRGELFQWRNQGVSLPHGWTAQVNASQWGVDYLTRASAARANIFSNAPQETMYFALDLGPDGKRLSGAKDYTITFAKGAVPPVKGFWSLTMYNKDHFFEQNEIHRYSVGTKNKGLKYAADGSLTIYMSHKKPTDPDQLANWLPSPGGEYSIYIRAYWPDQAILNHTWTPPAVVAK